MTETPTIDFWNKYTTQLLGEMFTKCGGSLSTPILFFYIYNDFFFIVAGIQCSVNFLLYSKVTQLHIHVYILFSHFIMLHHKGLVIVSSGTQQDLVAHPFQRQ